MAEKKNIEKKSKKTTSKKIDDKKKKISTKKTKSTRVDVINDVPKENVQSNKIDINDPNVCYFSVPMPFDKKVIDHIAQINKEYKKCKIGTFLNNMPAPFSKRFNEWFQVNRGTNEEITSYEQFGEVAAYAKSKGFDVCYLMNSPKPFSFNDFGYVKNHIYPVLEMLKKYGIDYIKFANTQVATVINYVAPGFRFSSSTACEYHTITQYKNLLDTYTNIDFIDMTSEENHNFALLKNLKKLYPNVRIEIMVNEQCLKGCPARISHASELRFCMFNCMAIRSRLGAAADFCKSPIVYPWFLEEYLKIGINNFKIVPTHGQGMRGQYKSIFPVLNYMDCIEHGIEGITANRFFANTYLCGEKYMFPETVMLSEIKELLPDVKHFIKNGHKCATACGVDCTYCFNCAKNLEKFAEEKGGWIKKAENIPYGQRTEPIYWEPELNPKRDLSINGGRNIIETLPGNNNVKLECRCDDPESNDKLNEFISLILQQG